MNVIEAIQNRRSVRAYSPKPIPADVLQRLRNALRWAPSACNLQPWHFIFVTEPSRRQELARACHDQTWMAQAPLIVTACGVIDQAYPQMGGLGSSMQIDVAIAVDHLALAAVAEGLGTCWIGAFDEPAVKKLLAIPAAVRVVALMPVGYPASANLIHPVDESQRKAQAEVFSEERW